MVMSKKTTTKLPYSITTDTLTKINFLFELSKDTKSPITVHQLLDLILLKITQETKINEISNGDIIHALSMALAVRMKMVSADNEVLEKIVIESISKALINGDSVEIRGLGRLYTKKLKENFNARNPANNKLIYKPERVRLKFKASNTLKKLINLVRDDDAL